MNEIVFELKINDIYIAQNLIGLDVDENCLLSLNILRLRHILYFVVQDSLVLKMYVYY